MCHQIIPRIQNNLGYDKSSKCPLASYLLAGFSVPIMSSFCPIILKRKILQALLFFEKYKYYQRYENSTLRAACKFL